MAPANTNPQPFSDREIRLARLSLRRDLSAPEAAVLGTQLATMDPWRTLESTPEALSAYLLRPDSALSRYGVYAGNQLAGVISIRYPWLRGPYIELLGLLDGYQGQGIGRELLEWVCHETHPFAKNVWIAASGFNARALTIYQKLGFTPTGELPDLVKDGYTEYLLRKRLG